MRQIQANIIGTLSGRTIEMKVHFSLEKFEPIEIGAWIAENFKDMIIIDISILEFVEGRLAGMY